MSTCFRFAVFVFFISTFTHAQQSKNKAKPTAKADPCAEAVSQFEMNECSAAQYKKADARLNRVYGKLVELMEKDLRDAQQQNHEDQQKYERTAIDKLKAAETAWIQYRDLHCDFAEQQYEGGSIRPLIWALCMKETTEHRIEELKHAYGDDRKLE